MVHADDTLNVNVTDAFGEYQQLKEKTKTWIDLL